MKIKELFSGPEKWTQRVYARDENRISTQPESEEAVCFCLVGAIERCYLYRDESDEVFNKIKKEVGDIIDWNDDEARTFEEVKALVEKLDI